MEIQKLWVSEMSEDFLKEHFWTLFICVALLLLTAQKFTAIFAVVTIIICSIYRIILAFYRPEKRKNQLFGVVIFVFTFVFVVIVNYYRGEDARFSADKVVFLLREYKSTHGIYPSSLELIGLDSQDLRQHFMLRYGLNNGQPILLYASMFNAFDKFYYDFEQNQWILHVD